MNMKIFTTCLFFSLSNVAAAEGQADISALVQTATPQTMDLYSRVSGYGTVVPEPSATMNLNFPKAGRVTKLFASPGQQVNKGKVLLEIATDPVGALTFKQAENAFTFARSELAHSKSLYARQLVSLSQVNAASKALKDAEGALEAQKATGEGVQYDKLKSPFKGTVVSVSTALGDQFLAGVNLVQLVRTDYLRTRLGIEPEDSRQISLGMKVRLASVFSQQRIVEGEVIQVAGQVDPMTQLVDVTVRIKGNTLLLGSKVRGDIATIEHKALAVPRQAVLRDESGAYLFQVINGKAHRVNVATGLEDGDWIEVPNTLVPNLPIVTLGNYELKDNMAVRESKQ